MEVTEIGDGAKSVIDNSQPAVIDEPFKVPDIPSQIKDSLEKKEKYGPSDDVELPPNNKPSAATVVSLSELKSHALSKISPAELLKEPNLSSVTYREPLWSGLLPDEYWIETIKNGVAIEKFKLDKAMASVGRSKHVDIILEHPSISRVHAVFQMRPVQGVSGDEEPGLYLFDIGSTHGTFLNKQRVEANCYNRVKVGHVIKFGSSTRLFIVHGPEGDAPAASPYTITEIKERNAEIRRKQQEMIEERKRQLEEKKKKEAESGVNWGFTEDAEQEF